MPELPEVETVKRGLCALVVSNRIKNITLRCDKLRYPIDRNIDNICQGQQIQAIERRAKYLIFRLDNGYLLIHLGMSGQLKYLSNAPPTTKHDHIDIHFNDASLLRYNDPRRFGLIEYHTGPLETNARLKHLGPEPLSEHFNNQYLFDLSRKKKVSVKQFIMQQEVVVGVGNIYAQEALFQAAILPNRPAYQVTLAEYETLCSEIKNVLIKAITAGGTTLKDFVDSHGNPGYFAQELMVYGRNQEPCFQCKTPLSKLIQSGRSTVYCTHCQC